MFTGAIFLQRSAFRKEIEGVMKYIKIQKVFGHALDLHNARITKLEYFFTVAADQVIVLLVFVGFFKLGEIFTELVFYDQPRIDQ